MDNILSKAGSAQPPNFATTRTATAKFHEQTILSPLDFFCRILATWFNTYFYKIRVLSLPQVHAFNCTNSSSDQRGLWVLKRREWLYWLPQPYVTNGNIKDILKCNSNPAHYSIQPCSFLISQFKSLLSSLPSPSITQQSIFKFWQRIHCIRLISIISVTHISGMTMASPQTGFQTTISFFIIRNGKHKASYISIIKKDTTHGYL